MIVIQALMGVAEQLALRSGDALSRMPLDSVKMQEGNPPESKQLQIKRSEGRKGWMGRKGLGAAGDGLNGPVNGTAWRGDEPREREDRPRR